MTSAALPFAIVYAHGHRWLVGGAIALYAGRKIAQFVRTDRALKQIRLEERFFRQQMDGATLLRCIRRSEHLWDDSVTLRALRGMAARPLPRILSEEEKTRRLAQNFHAHMRPLAPPLIRMSGLLPVIGLIWLLTDTPAGDPRAWFSLSIAGLLILIVLEVLQFRTARALKQLFGRFERGLGRWAIPHLERLEPGRPTAQYRHDLLYRDDPVYSAGLPRTASAPMPEDAGADGMAGRVGNE